MSGFVVGGSVVPPASNTPEPVIAGDGWYPAVDPVTFREQMRLRDGVTPARLREAILGAMIDVGNNLAGWRARHEAAGVASLGEVPSTLLGGESRYVVLYRRAIGASAKANLVERYRDTDLTGQGERDVGELDASVGELRRDVIHAVRDILGTTRLNVELI